MVVLQIADLHLSNAQTPSIAVDVLINRMHEAVVESRYDVAEILVIICGDITFQGDSTGYEAALDFFKQVRNKFNTSNLHFVSA